jgi:hypothetical protein
MLRMLSAAIAALCVALVTGQEASAWCKFNFGVGMNVGYEGGGNSILWGAFSGGPPPGAGYDGFGPAYGGGHHQGYAGGYPMGYAAGKIDPQMGGYPLPVGALAPVTTSPRPMPQVMPRASDTQPVGYSTYPQYDYNYPQYDYNYPQYDYNYYSPWPLWYGQ